MWKATLHWVQHYLLRNSLICTKHSIYMLYLWWHYAPANLSRQQPIVNNWNLDWQWHRYPETKWTGIFRLLPHHSCQWIFQLYCIIIADFFLCQWRLIIVKDWEELHMLQVPAQQWAAPWHAQPNPHEKIMHLFTTGMHYRNFIQKSREMLKNVQFQDTDLLVPFFFKSYTKSSYKHHEGKILFLKMYDLQIGLLSQAECSVIVYCASHYLVLHNTFKNINCLKTKCW